MLEHDVEPDPPLSADEAGRASRLSHSQLRAVDCALLAQATGRWRKLSYVIASAMREPCCNSIDLPDTFFALRIRMLVAGGALQAFGNLACMRYSEVRVPGPAGVVS